ncbi:hypothetical protein KKI24_17155 [bacterium]|nr:hypothetical protein [bacterium]
MSIAQDLRDLPPSARHFLLFSGINLISWQCVVGQVLVLFGRAIGMPPSWVGTLLSFVPLSMMLVIFSIPLVETYGSRKLMTVTWVGRNLMIAPVLSIPLAIKYWGSESSWYILLAATLCFAVVRAIGVGGWFPWLHEIVPQDRMGTYFSIEMLWMQMLNILVTFGIALILRMGDNVNRFYWVYLIGIMTGLFSVLYIKRIPGGSGMAASVTTHAKFSVIVYALKDRKYRFFMALVIISLSAIMWLNVASILYLRDILEFSDSRIMVFMATTAVGIAFSIRFGFKYAERFRSNVVMAALMGTFSLVAASWLGLLPHADWTRLFVVPIIILGGILSAGLLIFASKGMMSLVREQNRTGYTSMWIIGTSISNGFPPILAGWLIGVHHLQGYRICFLISSFCALTVSLLWSRFHIEDTDLVPDMHLIVKPMQPLRSLQRVVWMILHNRKNRKPDQ